MAHCPNCGKKLHLTDWRPECPQCGVNLVYYRANEKLLEESEKTEIEHAKFQPKIDRGKAAFFGSPPAIVRIVLSLLPIAGLFLPLCKMLNGETVKNINAVGVYNYISQNDFGSIFSKAFGGDLLSVSIVTLLLSVVMIFVCLICVVMSLGKYGKIRNLILNSVMLLFGAVSAVSFIVFSNGITQPFADPTVSADANPEIFTSCVIGAGIFVYLGLVLVLLVYNLVLAKKGLKIKHTPCLIGGLPSDEYFSYVEQGMSQLEIRKKMVNVLTKMQEEIRAKEAEARAKNMKI